MSDTRPIVGIDPGLDGALAAYWPDTQHIEVEDMPTVMDRKKRVVNGPALAALMADWNPNHAVLEYVAARPGNGASGMFRFGEGVGIIKGIVFAMNMPLTIVTPKVWKKSYDLVNRHKDAAREVAVQRFPSAWKSFTLKKHCDRAEAALMALYGANWLEGLGHE